MKLSRGDRARLTRLVAGRLRATAQLTVTAGSAPRRARFTIVR